MSFGLSFVNQSDVVVIDSEISRMCVIESGRLFNNGDSSNTSTNMFARTITTQEPPFVFARPDVTSLYADVRIIGSPGAWTGFYLISRTGTGFAPGSWFVCSFGAQAVSSFGLRLWGASSDLIFDSGTPAAIFTQAAQAWTYVRSEVGSQGIYTNYYTVGNNIGVNDYLMINNFSMRLLPKRSIVCSWNVTTNTLSALTQASNNPYAFNMPALFAKKVAN